MLLSGLLLAFSLVTSPHSAAAADTLRAPKPKPLAPTVDRRKPPAKPKGKPVGEPQLKRRKPPLLDSFQIR